MKAVFFTTDNYAEGGGLRNVDAEIASSVFKYREGVIQKGERAGEDYKFVVHEIIFRTQDGQEHPIGYGVGNGFVPSLDGDNPADEGPYLIPDPESAYPDGKLWKGSEDAQFFFAAINAGIPEDYFKSTPNSDELWKGVSGHLVAAPRGNDSKRTITVFSKAALPGKSASGGAAAASGGDSLALAKEAIEAIVKGYKGSDGKDVAGTALKADSTMANAIMGYFNSLNRPQDSNAAMQAFIPPSGGKVEDAAIYDDAFVNSLEGVKKVGDQLIAG